MVTRSTLFKGVWKLSFCPQLKSRRNVHTGRLQRKVDEAQAAPMIHSVRGADFVLRAPA
jgi:two-component system, OmpR family, response regulator